MIRLKALKLVPITVVLRSATPYSLCQVALTAGNDAVRHARQLANLLRHAPSDAHRCGGPFRSDCRALRPVRRAEHVVGPVESAAASA
jgi:hypothetical protein